MAFTDAGSQLGQSLGEKCDIWSKRLSGVLKLYDNAALCQFRNVAERKVKILKKLSRMGISGSLDLKSPLPPSDLIPTTVSWSRRRTVSIASPTLI